jgi:DNA-binding transcriptional ArsR family regulator
VTRFISAEDIASTLNKSKTTLQDVANFIEAFISQNNNGPTITEIGTAIGVIQDRLPLTKSTVFFHLKILNKRGIIELPPDHPNRIPGRIIWLGYDNENTGSSSK